MRRQRRHRPTDAPLSVFGVRIPMIALIQTLAVAEYLDPAPLNGSTLKYGFDHEGGPR